MATRSEKSAEAVVAADRERRAEREGVFKGIPMVPARHQKSARAERSGETPGEAGREPGSDEAGTPRHDTENTGSALLHRALTPSLQGGDIRHMVLFSAEFNQTAAPTPEDAGKCLFCIRKDFWRQNLPPVLGYQNDMHPKQINSV